MVADTFNRVSMAPKDEPTNMGISASEIFIKAPQSVRVFGHGGAATRFAGQDELQLRIAMVDAISDLPITISGKFHGPATGPWNLKSNSI